jgi:hypothetical protein
MKPTVEKLLIDDMIVLAAYAASLPPPQQVIPRFSQRRRLAAGDHDSGIYEINSVGAAWSIASRVAGSSMVFDHRWPR